MIDHTELCERLLALADSLVGDDWEHPLLSVETCKEAIKHLSQQHSMFALDMDNPLAEGLCLMCLDKNVLIETIKNQRKEILELREQLGKSLC